MSSTERSSAESAPRPHALVTRDRFWKECFPLLKAKTFSDPTLSRSNLEAIFALSSMRDELALQESLAGDSSQPRVGTAKSFNQRGKREVAYALDSSEKKLTITLTSKDKTKTVVTDYSKDQEKERIRITYNYPQQPEEHVELTLLSNNSYRIEAKGVYENEVASIQHTFGTNPSS